MNIFKKTFKGVPLGAIYPVQYEAGQECPSELLEQAIAAGVLENLSQDAPSNPPPDSQDKQSDESGLGDDQVKGDSESSDETQKTSKKAKNGKAPEDNQDAPAT